MSELGKEENTVGQEKLIVDTQVSNQYRGGGGWVGGLREGPLSNEAESYPQGHGELER